MPGNPSQFLIANPLDRATVSAWTHCGMPRKYFRPMNSCWTPAISRPRQNPIICAGRRHGPPPPSRTTHQPRKFSSNASAVAPTSRPGSFNRPSAPWHGSPATSSKSTGRHPPRNRRSTPWSSSPERSSAKPIPGHTQRRPPIVLTRDEVQGVLAHLENPWKRPGAGGPSHST